MWPTTSPICFGRVLHRTVKHVVGRGFELALDVLDRILIENVAAEVGGFGDREGFKFELELAPDRARRSGSRTH